MPCGPVTRARDPLMCTTPWVCEGRLAVKKTQERFFHAVFLSFDSNLIIDDKCWTVRDALAPMEMWGSQTRRRGRIERSIATLVAGNVAQTSIPLHKQHDRANVQTNNDESTKLKSKRNLWSTVAHSGAHVRYYTRWSPSSLLFFSGLCYSSQTMSAHLNRLDTHRKANDNGQVAKRERPPRNETRKEEEMHTHKIRVETSARWIFSIRFQLFSLSSSSFYFKLMSKLLLFFLVSSDCFVFCFAPLCVRVCMGARWQDREFSAVRGNVWAKGNR